MSEGNDTMNWTTECTLPTDVLGRRKPLPSNLTLKNMTKNELIDQIHIAQENYGTLLYLYQRSWELQDAMYKEATKKGIKFECLKCRYAKEG